MEAKLKIAEEISCDAWQGGLRHKFDLSGCVAQIVEPPEPLEEKLWFWLPEWPSAFPERNGVKELLQMGYYMVHINVFGKFGNPEAVEIMKSMYDYVRTLGFASKAALIGMSLGGLYSFRYAATYPETVACIYADAPVASLSYRIESGRGDLPELCRAYGVEDNPAALKDHPLSPVNNYMPMVKAGIPLLMIVGLDDIVVRAETNGLLLAERWLAAGGEAEVVKRSFWGHHPHGLDCPAKIVRFILRHTLNKAW